MEEINLRKTDGQPKRKMTVKEKPSKPEFIMPDLTKISNLEALKATDVGATDVFRTAGSTRKKSKFNFRNSELVPLPSRGFLYGGVTTDPEILEQGHIRLLPMTVAEEQILSTQKYIKNGSTFRMILDRCIDSDIDAKDILQMDALYLMFVLRSISYGDKYEFTLKCPNVTCGKKFTHSVDISKVPYNTLKERIIEPIEIKLPISKFTIQVRLPRVYDDEVITMMESNDKISSDETRKDYIYRYYVSTIAIFDEDMNEVPKEDWIDFFEALPGYDRSEINKAISFTSGIEDIKNIVCPYCETEFDTTIPVGVEFFRL